MTKTRLRDYFWEGVRYGYNEAKEKDRLKKGRKFPTKEEYIKLLPNITTTTNIPIYDTPEFTEKQRKKVLKLGQELYHRKLLQWRLGKKRGLSVYYFTRLPFMRWFLTKIALGTKFGHRFFVNISKKSRDR